MNYYYDVLLNFQDKYCMFYEWDKDDNVDFIKKIPLFHVDSKTYIDLFSKVVNINIDFLKSIDNKTKLKQNKFLKYTCIFSDGKNSLALEFNDNGLVINKSSLMLEDELNINEFMYSISLSNIDYQIISADNTINRETRQEEKVKRILKLEVNNMYKNKEYSKLKYIYLEWFNELLDSNDKMYSNMLDRLNETLEDKEYAIYEIIKLSYNNV